jgi:hypothetical protein
VTFADKLKVRLTGFKEYLDLPSLAVNTNDFFLCKRYVGADKGDPILFILLIPNANNPCRDLLILADHDIYRKQIFTAATALLADAKDLFDG